jgi:hypothetical protein
MLIPNEIQLGRCNTSTAHPSPASHVLSKPCAPRCTHTQHRHHQHTQHTQHTQNTLTQHTQTIEAMHYSYCQSFSLSHIVLFSVTSNVFSVTSHLKILAAIIKTQCRPSCCIAAHRCSLPHTAAQHSSAVVIPVAGLREEEAAAAAAARRRPPAILHPWPWPNTSPTV